MWWAVVAASLSCYAFKLAGLSVPGRMLEHPRVQDIALLLPVTLLAALAALQTFSSGQELVLDARVPAVAAAIVALLLRAPFIVVVLVAAVTAALIRLVT